jgi:hypothetical protein
MKKKKIKHSCNQCHREMQEFTATITGQNQAIIRIYACSRPTCPNFGLMQIPMEVMAELK